MLETQLFKNFERIGQGQVFQGFEELSPDQKKRLLRELESIDMDVFKKQQALIHRHPSRRTFSALTLFDRSGSRDRAAIGFELIKSGKAGCLILAGGMGTRLGFNGPKGCFVFNPETGDTLFKRFALTIGKTEKLAGRSLPVAIMTCRQNHEETVQYFEENGFFGLKNVSFFNQSELPLLDEKGNLFLQAPGELAIGPDGNGSAFPCFVSSGIYQDWKKSGVERVNTILVDNALAEPFDAELIGYLQKEKLDAAIKCTERLNPEEKVGIIVVENGHVAVVEYTELGTSNKGSFLANLSLFCFSMDFIFNASKIKLPLHAAKKKVAAYNPFSREMANPAKPNAIKCERFLFDALPIAHHAKALVYPRETCFAPLKNDKGPDSPETVRAALARYS